MSTKTKKEIDSASPSRNEYPVFNDCKRQHQISLNMTSLNTVIRVVYFEFNFFALPFRNFAKIVVFSIFKKVI